MKQEEAIERIKARFDKWALDDEDMKAIQTLIPELAETEDERIRKELVVILEDLILPDDQRKRFLAYLEKQKDASKAIEAVERIDKYIDEHLANAHDMKDSDPDKKYYRGLDDALGKIAGILQDVYSEKKQKESLKDFIDDFPYSDEQKDNKFAPRVLPCSAAWFEDGDDKQKEQKPDTKDADDLQLLGFIYDLLNEIEWKDSWAMSKDECLRRLNNYRPQKPAEWSEDYREEDIQTRFAFYTYKDEDGVLYLSNVFVEETSRNHGFGTKILIAAEKVAETIGATTISLKVKQDSPANAWYRKNGYGYVAFEDGYDWLEKNLEYMKPNKQEWSEEDEKTFWGLTAYIPDEELERLGVTRLDILKKFKSLRPQPKQEWTEEDEHRRTDAIYFLESAKSHYADTSEIEKTILWLKSSYLNLKKHNEDVAKLCSNEWSEEDEKIAKEIEEELWYPGDFPDYPSKEESELYDDCQRRLDWFKKHIKSLRPQSKDEIYKEKDEAFKLGKHQLAIEFMNYLDENRPEGKMSLSNAECEDIDKAFKENDWERIMRYVNKYAWKPSKEQVEALEDTMAYIPEFFKPKSNLASLLRDLKKQV